MLVARRSSRAALIFAWCGAAVFVLSLLYFLYSYLLRFGARAEGGHTMSAVASNVLLFSAFALHHSLFARAPIKAQMHRFMSVAVERSVYTWMASLLFAAVCWRWQPVPGELYNLTGYAALPGYTLQLLGLALTSRSARRLDVLDLAGVRPALDVAHGRDPVHVPLETRGVYGLVRHPLYLSWVLFVIGTPHMTMTRLVFAAVSTGYLAAAIPFEERSLLRDFGAEYRAYQRRVRWRMIPGLY